MNIKQSVCSSGNCEIVSQYHFVVALQNLMICSNHFRFSKLKRQFVVISSLPFALDYIEDIVVPQSKKQRKTDISSVHS